MRWRGPWRTLFLAGAAALVAAAAGAQPRPEITWRACLDQKPAWYGSPEAVRIADNVLLWQRDTGGWHKNIDMAVIVAEPMRAELVADKKKKDSTIDNGATYTQLAYLARVYRATNTERFREAFLRGVDYLLGAQYPNGGWPQYYPDLTGYYAHVTFNDDAMVGVLELLRAIAERRPEYTFVDDGRRARCKPAVGRGIECILKCQIVVGGKRTAWCAQHDEKTLKPAVGRTYERESISGSESIGVVRFLMGIDRPSPEIVAAVQAAVRWFNTAKITGIREVRKPDATQPGGFDKVVEKDPAAPPVWARFYEIGTNRPIFCGRDGIVKYRIAEIEAERRNGYQWYTRAPAALLEKDYLAWQQRWAPGENVLAR